MNRRNSVNFCLSLHCFGRALGLLAYTTESARATVSTVSPGIDATCTFGHTSLPGSFPSVGFHSLVSLSKSSVSKLPSATGTIYQHRVLEMSRVGHLLHIITPSRHNDKGNFCINTPATA